MNVERFSADLPFPLKLTGAAVSGLLLVASIPGVDYHHLSWIALLPLLLSILSERDTFRASAIGYTAGLVYYSGTFYWIAGTISTYGGLSPILSFGVFALFVVVFSFHTALFTIMLQFLIRRFGYYGLLLAGPTWVAVELLQTHLIFGGFPWMLVGYALASYPGILQLVTWTGIYGLSFLLVSVNAAIVVAFWRRDWRFGAAVATFVLIGTLVPAPATPTPSEALSVRLVQTNIDIDQSWQSADAARLLDELHDLSTADGPGPDLVVWPETPAPFYLGRDPEIRKRAADIAGALDAHFLIGYIDHIGESVSNSAGLLSPEGEQISRYDKVHLVPFGEYVPFRRLLFFAESLVRNVGDFQAGTKYTLSSIDNHRISTTICYEDVFPDLMRQFTKRGAEVIINITNDGWFGSTSAPDQHLRMAAVRAVENRRYLVKVTNTGITAIIDPYGNVLSQTKLGERTTLEGEVGYRNDLTFYVRYGDVFGYVMAIIAAAAVVLGSTRSLWPARMN